MGRGLAAAAETREDSEVPGARGSGWGRLRLRLLPRRPRLGALGLQGPPRSAVRASAVRPPGAFPEPPVMGAARGAPSSSRRLPLLSVLLLPLLGGESRRAGGAGSGAREPRWYQGAPGEWVWAAGAEKSPWRGWLGCEVPAAGRWPSPERTRSVGDPVPPTSTRSRFQPPRSFPGLGGEFCSGAAGSCRRPGPGGEFIFGRKPTTHP